MNSGTLVERRTDSGTLIYQDKKGFAKNSTLKYRLKT